MSSFLYLCAHTKLISIYLLLMEASILYKYLDINGGLAMLEHHIDPEAFRLKEELIQ